jgi:hypothetical protein
VSPPLSTRREVVLAAANVGCVRGTMLSVVVSLLQLCVALEEQYGSSDSVKKKSLGLVRGTRLMFFGVRIGDGWSWVDEGSWVRLQKPVGGSG